MHIVLALSLTAGLLAPGQVGIEPVTTTGPDGIEQTYIRIRTGQGTIEDFPYEPPPNAPADTGVLWVDRNHRNAICQSTAISGDGRHIFSNWYLNNERAGYYRVLANQNPIWESPGEFTWMYGGRQIGSSEHADVLTLSSTTRCVKWSRNSQYPDWEYPFEVGLNGFSRASHDGSTVAAAQNGTVYWFDAASGETLYTNNTVPEPTRLQGIDLSEDGSVVAVTVYDSCVIFEDGARRDALPIGTSTSGTQYAAALSGDGELLAVGDYYGYFRLYRWNGADYVQRWAAYVGTPWVAGIGISRDGSTVACGTGYNDGRLSVFDSSSATPLWTYQGYGSQGAYIACVALSADGSRIATASWGDRATSGTFHVFTIHDRADSTPIFGIIRDEEPGSLFSCDISDDGQFATCGGKAVHAQIMGNGGEVYSIIAGSSEAINVGMQGTTAPGRHIRVGDSYTPTATTMNYGDSTASFRAFARIDDGRDSTVYLDSTDVDSLEAGRARQITLSNWSPSYYSLYRCEFYTALDGDQYPGDDTLVVLAKCFHDARPELIRPPNAENTIGMAMTPSVVVRNNGSYSDAIPCGLVVRDSGGMVVYADSGSSGTLMPDSSRVVSLSTFTPQAVGPHSAEAWVRLAEDFVPTNDTLLADFDVTYEIMYDDGSWEGFYWVGRRNNDKFYARFNPTLQPPFAITGGRVYVNMANTPFDYVMLCEGTETKPDTIMPLQTVSNVTAPVAPGWAEFDFDVTRRDSGILWLVIHWPDNSPAMGVGADRDAPIDLRSYFSSNEDTFRLWTTHDWMMRLMQSPNVGVASGGTEPRAVLRLHAPEPNPFSSTVALRYSIPFTTRARLLVYDAAGRLVTELADEVHAPGQYLKVWKADPDNRPTAGVLFAKLLLPETGESLVQKLVLTH